ncbi:Metalloenzyme, LuxS/M16 peptidase-like protein [Tuber indicum]|nr:Metalloenzyme, LuxS/M16 peptidase-like protein [Tuber indicum]
MPGTHFKQITQFKADYAPSVITKYESQRTGMSAVVVDREGPKVLGYFALATEILDDSGAPHTLEHLCFMGSKNYRYKGVLDKMASRAYSNTNAWTATDHTAYTLESAGWEGFGQILPVYLEHVLLPTITDGACYTEVHHINGEGQDAGVVYSEMQGVENTAGTLTNLEAVRKLYPEGVGFRYETGGMMGALRVLTSDRIREFHKDMYQPKNLCVVIIGEIVHGELLKILDEFEDSIMEDIPDPNAPWRRPWIESKPVPQLNSSSISTVEFPEKDESRGEVIVGFLGPDCSDPKSAAALETLGTFLTGSSVSVLESQLVECEDPVASSAMFYVEDRPDSLIWLSLSSVSTKRLAEAEQRLFEALKKTVDEPLDFKYMQECLRRTKRQRKYSFENSGEYFATPVIMDHLFGKRDGSTLKNIETLSWYDELEKWGEKDWREFLRRWVAENTHVSVLGRPSAKLAKSIEEGEKARIAARKKELGEEGLKKLQERLDEATTDNEREIPKELLGKFPVPGIEAIHFIKTDTARAGLAAEEWKTDTEAQKIIDKDSVGIPLYLHYENVTSNFVKIVLLISTESIPVERRPLLAVYLENFFDTPVVRGGVRIEFEQVVAELERDTVDYDIGSASYMDAAENIRINFRIEPEKYEVAIKWLRELMWDSIFDKKRLATTLTKMKSDIPDEKRQGNQMSWSVARMVAYSRHSVSRAQDTLTKALYLKRISKLLEDKPEEVIEKFEELRQKFTMIDNIRILIVGELAKLKNPVSAWKVFTDGRPFSGKLSPIDRRGPRLTPEGAKPGKITHIVPLPTIDSSFSIHFAVGPDSPSHPKLPALLLAISYLDAVEGPLWRAVRGTGLAYSTHFMKDLDAGHLFYTIYRSPDAYRAWEASRKVINDHIDGTVAFNKHALEGALSGIVVSFADGESTMSAAATVSFINQVVHNQSKDYNMQLLKKVKEASVDDLRSSLKEFLLPIFQYDTSNNIIVTAPVKTDSIKAAYEKENFTVTVNPLSFFQDDYGLKYGLKDGQEEDDDDSDDIGESDDYDEDSEDE